MSNPTTQTTPLGSDPSVSFRYDGFGRLASMVGENGVRTSYAYDVMDRVTNIAWRTRAGSMFGGFDYAYDAVGRIVERRHSLGADRFDRSYSYDDRDRLVADGETSYAYDAADNRISRTDTDGAMTSYILGLGDRLASWTGGSYQYDAAGNVTRIVRNGVTLDLTWNSRYQLISVSTNGFFAESYAYDALGRRVATTNAEGTERHIYDNNWQVIADTDENGNVLRSYVWGEGIDKLLAVRIGSHVYTALTDIQGTVWGYADEQGMVVARWTYDAWGNELSESFGEGVEELSSVRYRFQGRELSIATGLTNFRMRWYDAVTGRWLSKDLIGLTGGLNLYALCWNDGLNKNDPVGLLSPAIWGPIVVGGLAGGVVGAYIDGWEGCWKGAVSGAGGAAVAVGFGGSVVVRCAVAGAMSEGLNGLMNDNASLFNVGVGGLMGVAFHSTGIGLSSGLWTNVWTLIYNWAADKLGK